jgi:hypothetical protein
MASAGISLALKQEIPADCKGITLSAIHDALGRDFLYVASKEAGLKIYDIRAEPYLIRNIPISQLGGLHVMNVSQAGDYLYLAIGNHFGIAQQNPGFAVIDVFNPSAAFVISVWSDPRIKTGAGAALNIGNNLYLCAMQAGLMIFDVSDRKNPKRLSAFVPDIHFPDLRADQSKINARSLDVQGDLVFLCYDAGGVRVINVKDKNHPFEEDRYSNPALNGRPRAYNNIVVDGSLIYVSADYCGLEILRFDRSRKIRLVSWWNPWSCPGGALQWFKSEGHANEIAFDKEDHLLFLATGKSDMNILDVAEPSNPKQVLNYGGPANGIGTWGVSRYANHIYLAYICTFVPFQSNWTGIKILTFTH